MARYVALVDGKAGAYGATGPDFPGCTSGAVQPMRRSVMPLKPYAFGPRMQSQNRRW